MVALLILYWLAVIVLFLVGLVKIIIAKTPEKRKPGVKLLIISIVMLIIGGGVCGIIMANLNLGGMH